MTDTIDTTDKVFIVLFVLFGILSAVLIVRGLMIARDEYRIFIDELRARKTERLP